MYCLCCLFDLHLLCDLKQFINVTEVAADIVQLSAFCFAEFLSGELAASGVAEPVLMGFSGIHARSVLSERFGQFSNQLLCLFPCGVEQTYVLSVGDLLRCTGGIQNQRAPFSS